MTNALELIDNKTPIELFGPDSSLDKILDGLEKDVRSIDTDISTASARKNVASIAYKVATTKTTLDAMGKGLTDEARKQIGLIDAGRRKMRDRLDALKDEVRKPLTEWENKEKDRVAEHEVALSELIDLADFSNMPDMGEMTTRLEKAKEIHKRSWEEFQQLANEKFNGVEEKLQSAIHEAEKRKAEQIELEKLRQEKEAREIKEREERIAREAAATAQKEAEEKAAQLAAEAEQKAQAEREAIERKAQDEREAAASKAAEDQARIAAAETARKNAEREAEQAAQAERDKIEAEKRAEQKQAEEREADKKHRTTVNNAAAAALIAEAGITEKQAKKVIIAIVQEKVTNIILKY